MGYPEYEPWLLNGIRAIRYLLSKPMGGRRSRYVELDINNHEAIPKRALMNSLIGSLTCGVAKGFATAISRKQQNWAAP